MFSDIGLWRKGDRKEKIEEAAIREVKEELGVSTLELKNKLGENEYIAKDPEKGPTRRRVTYFLAETRDAQLHLKPSGGLDDARWVRPEEFENLKTYDDIKPLLKKALGILLKK